LTLHAFVRLTRRTLARRGPSPGSSFALIIAMQKAAFFRTQVLVRIFYILSFVLGIELITPVMQGLRPEHVDWLWPVAWLRWVPPARAVPAIFAVYLLASLAAALDPRWRTARVATAVGLLLLLATRFSSGKIDHGYHFWLWTAGVLCLLPKRTTEPIGCNAATRHHSLLVFFGAQLVIALFFSVSGAWKLAVAVYQLLLGEANAFTAEAMARQVAEQFVTTHQMTWLGHFIVDHVRWGHAPYLLAIFLELFSLAAVFRPRLHRIWGCGLMLFQLGTRLVLDVWSPWGITLVGLIFVASPFAALGGEACSRDPQAAQRAAKCLGSEKQ
jgi:hypothetical protein